MVSLICYNCIILAKKRKGMLVGFSALCAKANLAFATNTLTWLDVGRKEMLCSFALGSKTSEVDTGLEFMYNKSF